MWAPSITSHGDSPSTSTRAGQRSAGEAPNDRVAADLERRLDLGQDVEPRQGHRGVVGLVRTQAAEGPASPSRVRQVSTRDPTRRGPDQGRPRRDGVEREVDAQLAQRAPPLGRDPADRPPRLVVDDAADGRPAIA